MAVPGISVAVAAQPGRTIWISRRVLVGMVSAVLLAWVAWWGPKHVLWWTPAGHEIAQVVRGAVGVNETILTPPEAYRNVPITRARMAQLSGEAPGRLAQYFTGSDLQNWRQTASMALRSKDLHHGKTIDWMTNARVNWVHLGELRMLPGSTTATATASAEFQSNGGVINRVDYTYTLVHSSAGWRIVREESGYELGYGP